MKLIEIKDKWTAQFMKHLKKGEYHYDGPEPKYDELMAEYTDPEGYKVEIRWGVKPDESMGGIRYGRMFKTNPEGKRVQAGYWMLFPEPEWKITPEQWQAMPLKKRAELEVKQQATAYKPLSQQFKSYE